MIEPHLRDRAGIRGVRVEDDHAALIGAGIIVERQEIAVVRGVGIVKAHEHRL